ncbi:MAG: Rrf2 family transcriptional regulator [Armatimonadota bacterium]|nr:MAG: Rrf2 family transcriptional regulator [Armatimonadota bacterium]
MIRLLDSGVQTEYAVRALACLAKRGEGAIVTVKELAQEADVSVNFLYAIFKDLEQHGLVHAHRGRDRGFSLTRPPSQISYLDILNACEGHIEKKQCLLDHRARCDSIHPCAAHQAWNLLRDMAERELAKITLDQIATHNPPWEQIKLK